jgi:hypothetical protein
LLSLVGAIGICSVYAAIVDETSLEGEGSISHISIDLDLSSDDDEDTDSGQITVPGAALSQTATVNNTGKSCYVRFSVEPKSENSLDVTSLNLKDKDNWVNKNGVYYYKSAVDEDDSLIIYDSITIPDTYTNNESGQDIGFTLKVDAVQADNFDVDLTSDTPWGDVTVKAYSSDISIGG